MTAFLANGFLCPRCTFLMGIVGLDDRHTRLFVQCQNKMCTEYKKVGSYPLQEVHLQPEETNG